MKLILGSLWIFTGLLAIQPCSAQKLDPVYRSVEDSVTLAAVLQRLADIDQKKSPADAATLDSLTTLQLKIMREGILRYRYSYFPTEHFTRYEDLKKGHVNPATVQYLSLHQFKGKHLPDEIFTCTQLKTLQLVDTKIQSLPSSLNNLPHLRQIEILNNRPKHRLKLSKNNRVNSLKIRGDQPNLLPKNYKHFQQLDTLDLSRNMLTRFPRIQKNKQLKELMLNENQLTLEDLHINKRKPLSLERLYLARNKISRVPEAIGYFTNLEKLTFNYNQISEVTPALSNLKKLQELSFYTNRLQTVPKGIYSLTELRYVDLYYNDIRSIDPAIGNMRGLHILYLANNSLTSLPDELGHLKQLRELYLHHNRLSFLPSTLSQLIELQILRINDNAFGTFPEVILALQHLENLDLSRNLMHTLPYEIVSLQKLQLLAITENPWDNPEHVRDISVAIGARGVVVHSD